MWFFSKCLQKLSKTIGIGKKIGFTFYKLEHPKKIAEVFNK